MQSTQYKKFNCQQRITGIQDILQSESQVPPFSTLKKEPLLNRRQRGISLYAYIQVRKNLFKNIQHFQILMYNLLPLCVCVRVSSSQGWPGTENVAENDPEQGLPSQPPSLRLLSFGITGRTMPYFNLLPFLKSCFSDLFTFP